MSKKNALLFCLLIAALPFQAEAQRRAKTSIHKKKSQAFYEKAEIKGYEIVKYALEFQVLGDWGRNGHYGQQEVADRMDETAYKARTDFFISTGDNFYIQGVQSVTDAQWRTSFEDVYHGAHLFADWYPVLGNHDYLGNPQAEIDYSNVSRRWKMPARYYSFERELDDRSGEKALFVFLDTSPFEKPYYTTPFYKTSEIVKQDTAAQMAWLNKTLAESTARWKIVIGHHPLYSSGKRAERTNHITDAFEPVFEKYKVDVYFAGHEHDLQHLKPAHAYTNHFVSGAGSEVRKTGKTVHTLFAESSHGFMSVSVTSKLIKVQVINEKGEVIYSTLIEKK